MATILITDGEQRSSLAAVRSLGRAGHHVIVCSASRRSIAGASRYCAAECALPHPLLDPAAYLDAVAAVVKERAIDVVLPMTEAALLAVLPGHERLGARLPFATAAEFAAISDKACVMEAARAVGVGVPRQVVIHGVEDIGLLDASGLRYPVVLKPARSVFGTAGRRKKASVIHAGRMAECRAALAALDPGAFPVLVQERVMGPGVGVFVLLWEGELLAAFAHRRIREKPPSGGVSVYRESIELDPDLLAKSVALVREFNWQGVAMVEYKVDAATGTACIMEINGRFWGSLQLAIDAGVDFPALLVAAACGGPAGTVTRYRRGVRSRWEWGEVDHLLTRLRHAPRELDLPDDAAGRGRALIDFLGAVLHPASRSEVFRWSDPRPFLRESADWLRHVLHPVRGGAAALSGPLEGAAR